MSDTKEQQQGDPGAVPGASTTPKGLKTQGYSPTWLTPDEVRVAKLAKTHPKHGLAAVALALESEMRPFCVHGVEVSNLAPLDYARLANAVVEVMVPGIVASTIRILAEMPAKERSAVLRLSLPIRGGSDGPQEDPFARLEEKFRSLDQLVRDSARAIDQLLAGHRAVSDEEAETLVPVRPRPGICSSCALAGVETMLGLIWCCRCDGAQCSRCCGSFLHRLDAVRIDRMVVGNLGTAILGVIRIRQESGGADRYEGRARFASEPVEAYFSVGNATPEAAWEHIQTWVASFLPQAGAR